MKALYVSAVALLLAVPAAAQTAPQVAGPITVVNPYVRSTNPKVGAAFMTLSNTGPTDCVLSGVQTDAADRAEMHTHQEVDGVMKMGEIPQISIPAGTTHALARGGDHVMLMGTRTALKDGDQVALTLDFGSCGLVPLSLTVDNARTDDAAKAGGGHGAMDHGQMDHGAEGQAGHTATH